MTGQRPPRAAGDAGFTLIEVLVTVALIATSMTALAVFLLRATGAAHHHADLQQATEFAVDAIERVPQANGAAILDELPRSQRVQVGGQPTKFTQSWDVTQCWLTLDGGPCTATENAVSMYQVKVTVTWPDPACGAGPCSYATSTLVAANTVDGLYEAAPDPGSTTPVDPGSTNPSTPSSPGNSSHSNCPAAQHGGSHFPR